MTIVSEDGKFFTFNVVKSKLEKELNIEGIELHILFFERLTKKEFIEFGS